MADPKREGMKSAAAVLARAMRRIAAVKTRRSADAVNTQWAGEALEIRAGKPEGVYGWEPITALMFDDDKRHPLFGDKKHWYHQGLYPITELTVRTAVDDAVDAFADTAVPLYLKEHNLEG